MQTDGGGTGSGRRLQRLFDWLTALPPDEAALFRRDVIATVMLRPVALLLSSAGILLMSGGAMVLLQRPWTVAWFVADFVGLTNRVDGVASGDEAHVLGGVVPLLAGSPSSGDVVVLVRPEAVAVQADPAGEAEVAATSFLGSLGRVQVRTSQGVVLAQVPTRDVEQLPPGTRVRLSVRPTPALAVPRR